MSMDVFAKACDLSDARDLGIFLGGGEPTLHPEFERMLGAAILRTDSEGVESGIITNGSNEQITMGLLRAQKTNVLGENFYVGVSLDEWHDRSMVSDAVLEFLDKHPGHVRATQQQHIVLVGRGVEFGNEQSCICESLFVTPEGVVRQCGCPDAPILGDVMKDDIGELADKILHTSLCWREIEKEMENEQ